MSHDHLVRAHGEPSHGLLAVGGEIHGPAQLREPMLERSEELGRIFNDQQLHGVLHASLGPDHLART